MTTVERVERSPPSEARRLLRTDGVQKGLSEAFFLRVAELSGSDPVAAARLASRWKLILSHGDSAAFTHRAKAVGERCRGKWLESVESFKRAALAAPEPVQRLSFQTGAVDSLARAGRVSEAVRLGVRLVRGLERYGEAALAARVRLNVGNALLWADEYEKARQWLLKAVGPLHKANLRRETGAALLALSTSELFGGDPDKARSAALEARAVFADLSDAFHVDLCSVNLAHEAILRGRADEAMSMLVDLRGRLATMSPVDAGRAEEFLGEAHFRLHLLQEAEDAFRSALTSTALRSLPLNVANCRLGLGLVRLAQGEPADAKRLLTRAANEYRRLGNATWAAAAETAASEALLAQGRVQQATRLASGAVKALVKARSPYLLVAARLALAAALVRQRKSPEPHLRGATADIARYSYPAIAWKAHAVRSETSRGPTKLAHYRKMFQAILESRLLVQSAVSRAAYLSDKWQALSAYLAELLARPGKDRFEEALRVISQSRSAALLDEILSSSGEAPAEEAVRQLAELREELNREGGPPLSGGPEGRRLRQETFAKVQRRWVEITHLARPLLELPSVTTVGDCAVLAETPESVYVLYRGRAIALPISTGELAARLKWLEFELLAPTVNRSADPGPSVRMLRDLRGVLVDPWLEPGPVTVPISPDGRLWTVPWQALLNLDPPGREPVLLPSPAFGLLAGRSRLPSNPTAAAWIHGADDLPNVEAELREFLHFFPTARVCRTSPEALRSLQEERPDILHVASHAISRDNNPMFSAIRLDDGWLYAAQLARSRARVGLVTLSACDTGRVSLWSRTEPDGMARAFLALGASSVVASAWPLDDRTAKVMMERFYGDLASGSTVAEALTLARRAARSLNEHPYFWAPLVLFSGYTNCKEDVK